MFSQKYADLLQTLSLALAPDLIFQRLRFKGAVAVRFIAIQPDVKCLPNLTPLVRGFIRSIWLYLPPFVDVLRKEINIYIHTITAFSQLRRQR